MITISFTSIKIGVSNVRERLDPSYLCFLWVIVASGVSIDASNAFIKSPGMNGKKPDDSAMLRSPITIHKRRTPRKKMGMLDASTVRKTPNGEAVNPLSFAAPAIYAAGRNPRR